MNEKNLKLLVSRLQKHERRISVLRNELEDELSKIRTVIDDATELAENASLAIDALKDASSSIVTAVDDLSRTV